MPTLKEIRQRLRDLRARTGNAIVEMGGVAAPTRPDASLDEQRRVGLQGWRVGCYNPAAQQGRRAIMAEVRPGDGAVEQDEILAHPCWPTHAGGWGISPHVLGLEGSDVPAPPAAVL